MFFRKKHNKIVEDHKKYQEAEIQKVKLEIHESIDNDLRKIDKINKVLSNGITLQVFHAVGGKDDR